MHVLVDAMANSDSLTQAATGNQPQSVSRRNKVERLFARMKLFRRIATRYEKTASSYLALLHLAGALCWLR